MAKARISPVCWMDSRHHIVVQFELDLTKHLSVDQFLVAVVMALGLAIAATCGYIRAYERWRIVLEWHVMACWDVTRHRRENGL